MGDERLRVGGEGLVGDVGDVVAGREDLAGAGDRPRSGPRSRGRAAAGPRRARRGSRGRARCAARGSRSSAGQRPRPGGRGGASRPAELARRSGRALIPGRRGRRPPGPTGPPRSGSRDRAGVLGLDRHLHLHRLEDHDGVALVDLVADRDLDLPHGAGDVGLDVRRSPGAAQYPALPRSDGAPVGDRRGAQRGRPDRGHARCARGGVSGRPRGGRRRRLERRDRRGRAGHGAQVVSRRGRTARAPT